MRFRPRLSVVLRLAVLAVLSGAADAREEPWVITPETPLVSRWPTASGQMREDRVTADLYRPRGAEGRVPAAVIINSSGGVQPHIEHHYARAFAREGMASLVVDSFVPRGVRRTGDDQSRVWQIQSDADAVAGFRWLAAQPWVDPKRIIVIGMSRGGTAALHAALEQYRGPLRATDVRFAAHVAIATGGCTSQAQDAKTTGAPVLFMLAELDDGTPAAPCLDYAQRMRSAGNPNVRVAVYPGVYHAYEATGGVGWLPDDETGRACTGRYLLDGARNLLDRSSGRLVAAASRGRQHVLETCAERGYTIGGDERVKAQATADLLQFLRDAEVLVDAEARAVVPDCGTFPEGIRRRNCARARNGWTGDLVALGRGFRYAGEPRRDDAEAARLFELAASRGHVQARWELAIMLRQGSGTARDVSRALALARSAAEAGDPAGMSVYGIMLRDGIGTPRDEAEAAVWFRRGAELRNSHAITNFGRMMWHGSGGLARDRGAAVGLWQRAVFLGDNPWAHLFLGEALEAGDGAAQDRAKAIGHYRAASSQSREPDARRRAEEALARLEPARSSAR
jgi:dienelactone hydrolase